MLKLSNTLKTLARSVVVAGLIGTTGAAGIALSSAPAVAQMHGGGGGFHGGGGGFHGGGFHGGGFHGGGFRDGFHGGGFRGDQGAFHDGFDRRGVWRDGRWYGPGLAGWYAGVDPYGDAYGCTYPDYYYYGYCDY